jgi:uncharacterized repeat protein (TIGR01451 family)
LPPLELTVNVGIEALGVVTNLATVSAAGGDANTANNTVADPTTVEAGSGGPAPELAISKSHAGDFTAGAPGIYTIAVQNVGLAATTGEITVTDIMPAGMSYASHIGDGWQFIGPSEGQTAVFLHPGPAGPNESLPALLLTVNVSPQAAGVVVNSVTVSTPGDPVAGNNTDEDPTVVIHIGDTDEDCAPDIAEDVNSNGNLEDDDTDLDGVWNYLDEDDDNDGVLSKFENPGFGCGGNSSQDTDTDGTPDYLDLDDDGDIVHTAFENPDPNGDGNPDDAQDTDGDGIPDYLDPDDDGDTVYTEFENPDPNGDGNPDDAQDTDIDGIPDYLDADDESDGTPTQDENPDPNGDGNPDDAQDSDGDDLPDYLDPDQGDPGTFGRVVYLPVIQRTP